MRGRAPVALAFAFALALVAARPALARADDLRVDGPVTAAVAGGAWAAYVGMELENVSLTPASCRWCDPPGLDRNARLHLRWGDTQLANNLSNLGVAGVPLALLATDFLASGRDLGRFGEDTLVAMEAVGVALAVTDVTKYALARRRPDAWASGVRTDAGSDNAFISGHAASTFALAAAFGTVARLRGYPAWPIVYAAGFTGAAAVSYFRIAADRHWLTDVAAGAAVGAAVGIGLPLLLHRRAHDDGAGAVAFVVTPMPLGVAGTF